MKKLNFSICLLFIGLAFFFQNCQDNFAEEIEVLDIQEINFKSVPGKIKICHYSSDSDSWMIINVSKNAVLGHLNHGDVIIDQDGDGFAVYNECGLLNENGVDCDDTNNTIYPGAIEITEDDVVNDCNTEDEEEYDEEEDEEEEYEDES